MKAYFTDVKIGDFIASENGLSMEVDFNASPDEDIDLSMSSDTIEEYIGRETIPLDYGSNHHGKLTFEITFSKMECHDNDTIVFTPHEIRSILRQLTGKQYYQKLYFLTDITRDDEMIYYRVKTTNTSAKRINGNIVGLSFEFTCDSFWGYTDDLQLALNLKAGDKFIFYNNSDEINDYLLPKLTIKNCECGAKGSGNGLIITNVSDNNRETCLYDLSMDEVVVLDSKTEQVESNDSKRADGGEKNLIVQDFNLKWVKFIPGRNNMTVNQDCTLIFDYRLLRKVIY